MSLHYLKNFLKIWNMRENDIFYTKASFLRWWSYYLNFLFLFVSIDFSYNNITVFVYYILQNLKTCILQWLLGPVLYKNELTSERTLPSNLFLSACKRAKVGAESTTSAPPQRYGCGWTVVAKAGLRRPTESCANFHKFFC